MSKNAAVIIHGGCGRYVLDNAIKKIPGLIEARDAAWEKLHQGAPGEVAVVAALRVMERIEYFNAGYGSYPNVEGKIRLDVGLMKGTLEFAAVMNLKRVTYASSVALDILEQHVARFTQWTVDRERDLEKASEEVKERYGYKKTDEEMIAPFVAELLKRPDELELDLEEDTVHGTVGCVVRDQSGKLFAGTSTGGVSYKFDGRVGDSPIVAAGFYADNEIGALSTTGAGEAILRTNLSGHVINEMRSALRNEAGVFENSGRLQELLDAELAEMSRKSGGRNAGMIVIPPSGDPTYAFRASMMSTAFRYHGETGEVSDAFIATEEGESVREAS